MENIFNYFPYLKKINGVPEYIVSYIDNWDSYNNELKSIYIIDIKGYLLSNEGFKVRTELNKIKRRHYLKEYQHNRYHSQKNKLKLLNK